MTPELRALVRQLITRPETEWPAQKDRHGLGIAAWLNRGALANPGATSNGPPSLTPLSPLSPLSPVSPLSPRPTTMASFLPCTDTSVRVLPPGWAPPPVGPFDFPEPWGTRATRITDDRQGAQLEPVGYSYWRVINAHRDRDDLYVMLACPTPSLFSVNKSTLQPRFLKTRDIPVTGEQVYFSAHDPAILYVPMGNGLHRVNVETGARSTVFEVDAGTYLWQCHSSDDERTHSATVRDTTSYDVLGWVVCREGAYGPTFIPYLGIPDECAVDGTGDWLVIKETIESGLSNRILRTNDVRDVRTLTNAGGALGHSDLGAGYVLGENPNIEPANALVQLFLPGDGRRLVYHGTAWSTGIGHISHTNVHDRRFCVISNASRDAQVPRQNELIQVPLDGSLTFRPLAPSLVDFNASGGGSDPYRNMPKANLDPYGTFVCWTSNHGTDHLDAFVGEVPPL